MSWPLASFLLVGVILAGGWLAYERTRPSARMVAVVATLAAIAALGRDAFVALPDVKPITAIAFVVGYALGPLPGFTVGALGMLASNIMLGQGPYTPWQMAAWGLVGLTGAGLGSLTRRLGRVPLALACAVSATMAKEIMNVYSWSIGASHTASALLVEVVDGLPFDITDTLATLLFALAFGPELTRLLTRTRERMTVTWLQAPSGGSTMLVVLAVLAVGGLLGAQRSEANAAAHAASLSAEVSYLDSSQNSDGGFGGARGQPSGELYTAWAAMGLAAAGQHPQSVRRAGHSPLDSLRGQASTLSGLGDVERTILAVHACGSSAYSFAGRDLVSEVLRARASDRSFEHQVNLTAFAVFALRAVGHSPSYSPIRQAAGWIEHQQNSDGGFGFGAHGSPSDVDDTGAALQALAAAGARDSRVLRAATGYLIRAQNPDGGFPQQPGGSSNAQSTAWAIQGLISVGQNIGAVRHRGSRSPTGYLESLLAPGGSIRYSSTIAQSPVWVTAQALIALAGKTFPVSP